MRRMMRWCVFCGVALLVATACSDAFGVEDILGTWNVMSINGHPLPAVVKTNGEEYNYQYLRFTFVEGGKCTFASQVDDVVDSTDSCDYTVNFEQKTISVSLHQGSIGFYGSIDGNEMTLNAGEEVVLILRRQ